MLSHVQPAGDWQGSYSATDPMESAEIYGQGGTLLSVDCAQSNLVDALVEP